jgi:hypothetical protein
MVTETKQKNWLGRHPVLRTILGILLILIAVGWFVDSNFPSEQKTQENSTQSSITSESWHNVTYFSGEGNKNTESFFIKGDKVKITARTWNSYGVGSFSAVDLKRDDEAYIGTGLMISTQGSEDGNGETIYRNLKIGNYYISVISGINWEVNIEDYY